MMKSEECRVKSEAHWTVCAAGPVKHNIVYILCKHILYVLCKHIVYEFSLIPGQFYLLGVDHCELKRPFSSGTPVYPR